MRNEKLRHNMQEKVNKSEKTPNAETAKEVINTETPENTEKKEFDLRLADLKNAIAEMEKHNKEFSGETRAEITEEMFENIMDIPFSEFEDYVNGGKIINEPDIKNFHDKVTGIINGEFNEAYQGNRFRQVMNKPVSRVLFAALCLFLKFGAPAQAHNNEKDIKDRTDNKTEIQTPNDLDNNPEGGAVDEHTYRFNPNKAAENELKESSSINITQGFEVDKANISEIDASKIKTDIENFINKITPKNFEQYKHSKRVISVSSDERATRYGSADKKLALENNIKLSNDRFLEGEKIVREALNNHDYSKSGLTEEQIKEIKEINFNQKMPEKGYTKITELNKINPLTGEKYTDQDVETMKKNDPALYKKLSDECRYVKLDLMVEQPIQKISQADRVLFFIDNSPSTEHTKSYMATLLEKIGLTENSKGNIAQADLVYYSNDASPAKSMPNILAAADDLRRSISNGSSIENPFKSSISYLNSLIAKDDEARKNGHEVEDYRSAVFTLDEGVQDAQNIIEAAKLLEEAHVKDANIFIFSKHRDLPLEKNVFELKDQIEKKIKANLKNNLEKLEQSKQDEEHSLNNLIEEANAKLSPKTMHEFFGQDKLSHENGNIKIMIEKNHQASYLHNADKPVQEKIILNNLIKSINNLDKVNNLYSQAKNTTFENYLKTTQIEVKVFTDEKGQKVTFDVIGYDNLAKNIERTSMSL